MTAIPLPLPPIAAIGWELLSMMLGAAVLGASFVFAATRLFDDKPVRRRKLRRPLSSGGPR